ncbi:cation:proton antiporter [Anaerococcus tetradius]|uniref:Transporter, CPA2 family n=2 Tax=Anaerococcus tetradius TaxID=33036 RepID=A0A133KIF2_9FIRM|nr:cation:proton antiporter [Anaerococcus tetradius]KWZ79351.1 transporter, CPA2 family [Anaerococcus tetradius]
MLVNLAIIMLTGLMGGKIFSKIKIAPLLGMLLAGILISPNLLGLVRGDISNLSKDLRQIALVVILTRAGLSLSFERLREVGISAVLMTFLPASFEIVAITFLANKIFNLPYLDSAILGAVLGAVSPAIVVPRMLKLIKEGYGEEKKIAEIILAGSSIDDVYTIVFFTVFINLKLGGEFSIGSFLNIPISIITGILFGILMGYLLDIFYSKIKLNKIYQAIVLMGVSFLILGLETYAKNLFAFSGLVAIIAMAMTIKKLNEQVTECMLEVYGSLWELFEILLFVLVGITVDLSIIGKEIFPALILITGGLIIRMFGVYFALLPSNLNKKEKIFSGFAYLPKATVQAAIGPVALSYGIGSGKLILAISVIAILYTAPLGAILTDKTYKKLLVRNEKSKPIY